MKSQPTFSSLKDYRTSLSDVDFWWQFLSQVLEPLKLVDSKIEPVPGIGSTYPTFLYGDVVVKFFGQSKYWFNTFNLEKNAHKKLAENSNIQAPNMITSGSLNEFDKNSWHYIVTSRVPGIAWCDANLNKNEKIKIAKALGEQFSKIHKLSTQGIANHKDQPILDFVEAAEKSCLPPHLVLQIPAFLKKLKPFEETFVHSDIISRHVFIEDGELSGIIDWGDAMISDRHIELSKLYLDMFECDKDLLKSFLLSSQWKVDKNFATQALGLTLHRQALGLAQHFSFDNFHIVAKKYPLDEIATLEELADLLFQL